MQSTSAALLFSFLYFTARLSMHSNIFYWEGFPCSHLNAVILQNTALLEIICNWEAATDILCLIKKLSLSGFWGIQDWYAWKIRPLPKLLATEHLGARFLSLHHQLRWWVFMSWHPYDQTAKPYLCCFVSPSVAFVCTLLCFMWAHHIALVLLY